MKVKISATFLGKCEICGRATKVFKIGDEESRKTLTICKECAKKLGNVSLEEAIKKYGKKDERSFEKGVKRL